MCLCAQLYPTPCNPMTAACQTPLVHGISHARMLEWLAISFSRGSSWPRNRFRISCIGRGFFFIIILFFFFFFNHCTTWEALAIAHIHKIRKGIRPPWWLSGKESTCQCRRHEFDPCSGTIPWRRQWQPTSVFLPEKSHGERSLVGYSPWGCEELDMT